MNTGYRAGAAEAPAGGLQLSRVRFHDLLDQLRAEYDLLTDENRAYRELREEYQRKVEEQVAELTLVEQSLADLDRRHQMMKEQYDAEIARHKSAAAAAGVMPATGPGHDPPPVQSGSAAAVATGPGGGAAGPSALGGGPTGALRSIGGPSGGDGVSLSGGGPVDPGAGSHAFSGSDKLHSSSLGGIIGMSGDTAGARDGGVASGGAMAQDASGMRMDLVNGNNLPEVSGHGMLVGNVTKALPRMPSASYGFASGAGSNGGIMSSTHGQGAAPLMGIGSLPSVIHTPHLPSGGAGSGQRLTSASDTPMVKMESLSSMAAGGPTIVQQMNSGRHGGIQGTMNVNDQHAGEDDYVVYHGRAPNGSIVDMKVSLQSSLPHDSVVCCVRYSWDGDYLATGSNRSAHIFDVNSGQRVAVFSKDDGTEMDDSAVTDSYVRAVCFSRDGQWLITGAEDHVVKVWDVRNRTVKHKLVGHDTDIYSVDASANGAFIISGSGDKKAKLWSLESGKLLSTLGGEYGPTDGITSVSVSPTSQHVAAGSLDKIVRVWDVESSRLVRQFEGHRDSVYSVAFSPDGRLLLSGSLDKTLKLWDLAASQPSQQCRLTFTGHKDFVLSVAFSPNGRWLISGSKDRTVQFWDPRQQTMCLMLQGHKNSVISIAHNPVTMSLATGSGDCRARLWNISPGP